jgi:uncharacterized membrane protein
MKRQFGILLQGMAVIVPVIFTAWVLWATVTWLDGNMRQALGTIPYLETFPGLGIIVALGSIYVVGLLTRVWLFRRLVRLAEKWIERVPLVKTLYGSVRDMLKFFDGSNRPKGEAVKVDMGEMGHMVGISTTPPGEGGERVGVYLPLSYQLGGFLVYMPKEKLTSAGMGVESALKLILTGGMGDVVESNKLRAEPVENTQPSSE